jgi:chromate transporter
MALSAPTVSFATAARFWLKLGFISFGGPAGQIAIMHEELVVRRRWISERRFLHALSFCMLLPGPEAQQLATYLGWLLHRTWGGIVAGGLFVLPSLVVLIGLSWAYMVFGSTWVVSGMLWGVKPVVIAVVAHAAWRIGGRALRGRWPWVIALAALVAIALFNVPFPLIILAAAVLGWLGGRLVPGEFGGAPHGPPAGAGSARAEATASEALIGDTTPPPSHAAPSLPRLVKVAGAGLLLWLLVTATLAAVLGWGSTFTRMGLFFTKAALVTFGGAYSVLPYVYQGAVAQYGWLSVPQMIDGLALGESTPGPLIMIVAFVGFVGSWNLQALGPDQLFLAGALGAAVVTFYSFLPSFLFVLGGGPYLEHTRDDLRLSAPLAGISAAVVGVVLQLGVFLAAHVFWPDGLGGAPSWAALVMAALAGVALFRYRWGIITVIGAGALVGLLRAALQAG